MGLIGFFVTLVIMVLGVGYYFFGMTPSSLTVTNETPVGVTSGVALYEDLKTQANDIKDTEEERVEREIASLEEGLVVKPPQESVEPSAPGQVVPEKEVNSEIRERLMGSGFAVPEKNRAIDTIVLHSSYNPNGGDPYSVAALVKIYESYGVSAHYLIDRGGTIYRLVADRNIAYHAGVSQMADGRKNVNDFSIGIEMMNQEDTEFTKAQYEAVNQLVASLRKKYSIKYVVGHADIAPDRKTDPWHFDWKRLK